MKKSQQDKTVKAAAVAQQDHDELCSLLDLPNE